MQVIVSDNIHNRQYVAYDKNAGFIVGSADSCQVVLNKSRFISPEHLTFDRQPNGWTVTVHESAAAVTVDGRSLSGGKSSSLKPISEIVFPGYSLRLIQTDPDRADGDPSAALNLNSIQREIHKQVLKQMELRTDTKQTMTPTPEVLLTIGRQVDEAIQVSLKDALGAEGLYRKPLLMLAIHGRLQQVTGENKRTQTSYEIPGYNPILEELYRDYESALSGKDHAQKVPQGDTAMYAAPEEIIASIASTMPDNLQQYLIASHMKKIVCDLIFGLGPLQDLLEMPDLSEIMVVSPTLVYVEQQGKIHKTPCTFLGDDALMAVLERIVAPLGRRIDRTTPLVDARLPDGSRVNAIIPPLALKGPCLTIRRFPAEQITCEHLLRWGAITAPVLELLRGVVRGRKNVIIAGGTGSGKTTMLNALSASIPREERIVTIEDSAELQMQHEHLVSLEARSANVEGKGAISIRDLIKNALRMRPDRIIVGECRGAEAFDMLQAMNTGHDGSMTTVHANSPQDVMTRLESMCLMAVEIPLESIRQQISAAIDVIVYLERLSTGQRMVTAVAEAGDIHPVTGNIITRLIFKANYDAESECYQLESNGYIPQFLDDLASRHLVDIHRIFSNDS